MNGLVYGILGVVVLITLVFTVVYYRRRQPPQIMKLTCGDCVEKGGECVHDRSGKFLSCKIHLHGNPHKGGENFVAKQGLDAYYTFYGVPNFPL